jgi:hypothetical protein
MNQWYYGSTAGQSGPVDERQLREMISTGQIAPETLVWRDGMKDWARLDSLPEFNGSAISPYAPSQVGVPGYPGYYPPPAPTSGLAIGSLVCGILSIFFCYGGALLGIPAVICGHMAMSAIANSPFALGGRGMAIAGLVLGYLGILFTVGAVAFVLISIGTHG